MFKSDWNALHREGMNFDGAASGSFDLSCTMPQYQLGDFVGSMNIGRNWGLSALRSGRPEPLLPSEVAAEMASARHESRISMASDQRQS